MTTDEVIRLSKRNDLYLRMAALIQEAEKEGFVMTVETIPRRPLTMGNYGMLVTMRDKRGVK